MFGLDDHPTLRDMLAPTLQSSGMRAVLCSPYTGTLAIVPLRADVSWGELELACDLHAALERGLLVLV